MTQQDGSPTELGATGTQPSDLEPVCKVTALPEAPMAVRVSGTASAAAAAQPAGAAPARTMREGDPHTQCTQSHPPVPCLRPHSGQDWAKATPNSIPVSPWVTGTWLLESWSPATSRVCVCRSWHLQRQGWNPDPPTCTHRLQAHCTALTLGSGVG